MWWFLKKIRDDDIVSYQYGAATKVLSGQIDFDKRTKEFNVVKVADNDTMKAVSRFLLEHIYHIIVHENCPSERQIAIG